VDRVYSVREIHLGGISVTYTWYTPDLFPERVTTLTSTFNNAIYGIANKSSWRSGV
jgi:hypothetical protein